MENTKVNFMKFKSFGFGLSSVLAFGSIILLLMGVNLGIDFKGGGFWALNHNNQKVNLEDELTQNDDGGLSLKFNDFVPNKKEVKTESIPVRAEQDDDLPF